MKKCSICNLKFDRDDYYFCSACGAKTIFDPDFEQIIIKVDKYKCGHNVYRGFNAYVLDIDPKKIVEVWASPFEKLQSDLPTDLIHQKTAFYQDRMHDWNINTVHNANYLRYSGAESSLFTWVWLILVVKKEN